MESITWCDASLCFMRRTALLRHMFHHYDSSVHIYMLAESSAENVACKCLT